MVIQMSAFQPPDNYQRGARVAVPCPVTRAAHQGIIIRPLRWHTDPRGALAEVWRESWRAPGHEFNAGIHHWERQMESAPPHCAQVYISTTARGVVKGWHLHATQSDRFFLLSGRALLVTCDLRTFWTDINPGPFVETMLDPRDPISVEVLPGVAHGWIALEDCAILNCVSHEYQGDDEFRTDPHGPVCPVKDWPGKTDGPTYDWFRRRDG